MKKFNVLGCNDQFFKRFLNVLIFNASFGIGLINNAVPGKFGINYYICTGEDPEKYNILEPKVSKLCSLMCGSSHIRSVLIGVKYRNCCRTLDAYLLFAI